MEGGGGGDHFDRLPDCLLLDILDRVSDVRSLSRCLSLSRRFRSLVPLSSSLRLLVDRVVPEATPSPFSTLVAFLTNFLPLPLLPQPPSCPSPRSVLRGFRSLRDLDIRLPSPPRDESRRGAFLRYRATFGGTLERCAIIVGFAGRRGESAGEAAKAQDEEEEVKERVFWVIRALVDACRRHDYAARELVRDHPGLARLRMSDAAGEGVVEMDRWGLEECRGRAESPGGCRVPGVRMRMWYGREAEVSHDGETFRGATLVLITAEDRCRDTSEEGDEAATAAVASLFEADEGCREAVGGLMMKRRSYSLEMNSFLV